MLFGIRLPEDSTENLLHVHGGRPVGKRSQNIGEGTVPALFQRIDCNDVPDWTVTAQQILAFQVVNIGRLDGDLILGNTHAHKHSLDFIVGIAVLTGARLRLEQNDGTDIRPARSFLGDGVLLDTAAKLDRVLDHTLPRRAVINDNRQLDHVLFLQLARIHIGNDIAVAARSGR